MRLFAAVVIGVAIGAGIAALLAAREQERAPTDVSAAPGGTRGA